MALVWFGQEASLCPRSHPEGQTPRGHCWRGHSPHQLPEHFPGWGWGHSFPLAPKWAPDRESPLSAPLRLPSACPLPSCPALSGHTLPRGRWGHSGARSGLHCFLQGWAEATWATSEAGLTRVIHTSSYLDPAPLSQGCSSLSGGVNPSVTLSPRWVSPTADQGGVGLCPRAGCRGRTKLPLCGLLPAPLHPVSPRAVLSQAPCPSLLEGEEGTRGLWDSRFVPTGM